MRVTKYLFLFAFHLSLTCSLVGCCQGWFKKVLSPEEKRELELKELKLKAVRAATFKNKLFAIEDDHKDYRSNINSYFTCIKTGREEFNTNFDVIKNLSIVKDKGSAGLNILIPNIDLDNEFHKYSSSEKLVILKDEGVVVYFFYEDDKKILYIYHKGIKNKISYNKRIITVYINGYKYVEENIDYSSSLDFIGEAKEKWLVRKCDFISNDLMSVTFHKEKAK